MSFLSAPSFDWTTFTSNHSILLILGREVTSQNIVACFNIFDQLTHQTPTGILHCFSMSYFNWYLVGLLDNFLPFDEITLHKNNFHKIIVKESWLIACFEFILLQIDKIPFHFYDLGIMTKFSLCQKHGGKIESFSKFLKIIFLFKMQLLSYKTFVN